MNGSPPQSSEDPIAVVVDLIAAVEPRMPRPRIEDVVSAVAGGRFKRDRLARALVEHPQLLREGRSPAPRVVGDLLIALRHAGAVHVVAPVCAGCDKPLRSMYRRGQDWFRTPCGRPRRSCTRCGQFRPVTFRDRDGRPLCGQCSPADGDDPLEVVVEVVAGLDPSLSGDVVRAAVRDAVPVRRLGLVRQDRSTVVLMAATMAANRTASVPPQAAQTAVGSR